MPMNRKTGHLGRSTLNPRLGARNALVGQNPPLEERNALTDQNPRLGARNAIGVKPRFKTISDVRAANKQLGHHFFDKDTMKFFKSKIESGLIKQRFFITSEQPQSGPRQFKVREVQNNGAVTTWTFGTQDIAYQTKKAARDAITIFATKTRSQAVF